MKIDIDIELLFEIIIEKLYKDAMSLNSVVVWMKSKYGLKASRCYTIIREAKTHFGKYMSESNETLLRDCVEILSANREKASKQGNLKEVRECTKEIAKLQQLYVQKMELDIKNEIPLFGPKPSK